MMWTGAAVVSGERFPWLVRVDFVERLTGEAGGHDAGEVGAFEDVFVRAAQRVREAMNAFCSASENPTSRRSMMVPTSPTADSG
jgi:hypothetical protein